MNNLFSSFDPQTWTLFPLNWASSLLVLLFVPQVWSVAATRTGELVKQALKAVAKEFAAILNPSSISSILILPLSLFLLILLNNALGLLPYVFTSSAHLTLTIGLALPLWLGHMMYATINTPTSVLAHLVPLGTPSALMPFMVVIEIISSVIRPLTLSVRLAANMIAGHLLLALLGGNGQPSLSPTLVVLMSALVLLAVLECAVSMIQAYVFSVLSTLYVNEVNSPLLS